MIEAEYSDTPLHANVVWEGSYGTDHDKLEKIHTDGNDLIICAKVPLILDFRLDFYSA